MNNLIFQLLPHISFPTEIYFKKGSLLRLKFLEQANVLILTGKSSFKKSGSLDKIQNLLESNKSIIKQISIDSEPEILDLYKKSKKLISSKVDLIIACGGGSV